MIEYNVNKCVCNRRLKSSLLTAGSRSLSGNEFQTDGPATDKARGPNVLRRHRGTTRNRRAADQRWYLSETWESDRQTSVKYCGAWPCTTSVCTRLVQAHPAAERGGAATSLGLILVGTGDHTSQKKIWPIASRFSRLVKITGTDTDRSATCDFL